MISVERFVKNWSFSMNVKPKMEPDLKRYPKISLPSPGVFCKTQSGINSHR